MVSFQNKKLYHNLKVSNICRINYIWLYTIYIIIFLNIQNIGSNLVSFNPGYYEGLILEIFRKQMLAVTGCTPPPTAHKENDDGGDANEENDIDADK